MVETIALGLPYGSESLFAASAMSLTPRHPPAEREADGSNAALALALMRSLPESIYLLSLDGRVVFANQPGLARLGQSWGGVLRSRDRARHWSDLWPAIDQKAMAMAIDAATEGETTSLSVNIGGNRGMIQCCALTVAPVEDARGCVTRVLLVVRDGVKLGDSPSISRFCG